LEERRSTTSPVLVSAERPITEWLKPVADKPGTFKTEGVGRDRDIELMPFYRLHRRTYAAYWDLFTPPEYDKKTAEITADRERLRKLETATISFVQPGETQAEKDVNQQGEDTTIVRVEGRPGRRGTKWFSYDIPVDAASPATLVVTYHMDNRRTRTFDIVVDGQRIAGQTLDESSESRFFDVEYPLPQAVVAGKQKVTVRFQATNGNEIGAVFGLRTIRKQ
jgi:uncharacterized protein